MHHVDLGLFKYQLDFTQEILKEIGGVELQKEFDVRLRQIPRFPGLKLINKFGQLKVVTAADYRHIMKIAIFALDGIFEDSWNQLTCDELCDFYVKFSKMYMISKKVLVEIIQIGYKSDVRFVVDLRKICSRISDF